MKFDRVAFASRRRKAQDDLIAVLEPAVGRGLDRKQAGSDTWWRAVLDLAHDQFNALVTSEGGEPGKAAADWATLSLDLVRALTKTRRVDEYTHTVIATMIASDLLSVATMAAAKQAGEPYELEWVSMHDGKVRHTHRVADGQRIRPGERFLVGGSQLRRPGDVSAPVKEWINCRCTVAAVPLHDNEAAASHTDLRQTQGVTMKKTVLPTIYGDALVAAAGEPGLIPWYGVLAPEGKWSGDRRRFDIGSLSHRDLPLPFTWQKFQEEGHNGSVTTASIDWVDQDRGDDMMHAGGMILATPEADEWTGLLAHFGQFGVSIDGDMAEGGPANEDGTAFDLDSEDEPYGMSFSAIRVCSASSVNIPAFAEATIQMGEDPDHDYGHTTEEVAAAAEVFEAALSEVAFVSEKPWDGSASRFSDQQWKTSCILHKCDGMEKSCHSLPIKEPGGQLSRAGVHAAAGRLNQVDAPDAAKAAAKRALRSAYKQLGEEPPESIASALDLTDDENEAAHGIIRRIFRGEEVDDLEKEWGNQVLEAGLQLAEYGRGPGWVTNPADTKRIHDYWTVPGQPGYGKVGWGTPGDFERCRTLVGEEIGENSADKLRFLNQICAQWHHDATGFWPGKAPAERAAALEEADIDGTPAPAFTLVASAASAAPPHEWFTDPHLSQLTPITITEEGRIFGHIADWTSCHMGFGEPGQCINPPRSENGYATYLFGETMTDAGPVPTGPVTLGTGHAAGSLGMRAALAHYDNTGTAVADVVAGDDEFGPWISGWVRPWIGEEKLHELRAGPPSGDWRRNPNSGDMEMIAVLAVNTPGFGVRRVGYSGDTQVSLVASLGTSEVEVDSPLDELADKVAAAIERREIRRKQVAELAEVFD